MSNYSTGLVFCDNMEFVFFFIESFTYGSSTSLCSLLLRRECCSFSNGEYVKAGLAELEQWCILATEEVTTSKITQVMEICIYSYIFKTGKDAVCRFSMG